MDNRDEIEKITLSFLYHQPSLLFDGTHPIRGRDFFKKTHKQIYSAMADIYTTSPEVSVEAIKLEIGKIASAQKEFLELNGNSILGEVSSIDVNAYSYDNVYGTLKKYSLFQDLKEKGIDTTDLYNPLATEKQMQNMLAKLSDMSYKQIIDHYREKMAEVEDRYENFIEKSGIGVGEGLEELVNSLKEQPEIGLPFNGDMFNTMTRGARRKKVYINSASSGAGKRVANTTPIPTPSGWKTVGDIKPGDVIFGKNGQPTKVLEIFPSSEPVQIHRITLEDGRYIDCCNEHLWTYYRKLGKKSELTAITGNTQEMMDYVALNGIQNKESEYRLALPMNEPVHYPKKELHPSPYVMGALLGDGSFRTSESNKNLSMSSGDVEIVQRVALLLDSTPIKDGSENYNWGFKPKETKGNCIRLQISDVLREYPELIDTYSHNKFIPQDYLQGSIEQRWELLRGLMDTDGHIDKDKGRVSIAAVSVRMKDGLIELVRSLGMIATVREDKREDKNKNSGVCYSVHILCKKEDKPKLFSLSRKRDRAVEYSSTNNRTERRDVISIVDIRPLDEYTHMTCFTVDAEDALFQVGEFVITHNTRVAVGNAVKLSCPLFYDTDAERWVETGLNSPTLVITTELEHSEVQTMALAYISGVNEEKILNNSYDTGGERLRVEKAIQILKDSTPLFIEFMPDPSIDSVSAKIRLYALQKDVEYVFYDYVHVSASTYVNKKDMRDDVWLMLFVDKLKQLANELDIHISTATQVNSASYEDREVKNEAMIRGAKSVADKADIAYITTPIVKEQEKALAKSLAVQQRTPEPNQIIDLYKNRRGKWRSVRLWRYVDLGTCRSRDCFVTDLGNNPLDITVAKIKVQQLVHEGSFPIVNADTGEIVAENRRMVVASEF